MELTKGQKRVFKRTINSQYEKYIVECLKTGKKALLPNEWFEKVFRKKNK